MKKFRDVHVFSWGERRMEFHSMLKFCGHECVTGNYNWNGLKRGAPNFILWQHTVAGEGALVYEGRKYRLSAGDSMLVHIPHDHVYFLPEDSSGWEFKFVGFNGRELIRIAREIERLNGPVLKLKKSSEPLRLLNSLLADASENRIQTPASASGVAYRMICSLTDAVASGQPLRAYPAAIGRAVDLCLNSPGRLPSVETLAGVANMSRFHFSREFKTATGIPPAEFVRNHALRRASGLLLTASYSVKEVAEMSGFNSESAFCRAYKRFYGVSPRQSSTDYP